MKVFIIVLIVLFVFMLGLLIRILFMRHAQLHPKEKKRGRKTITILSGDQKTVYEPPNE